MRGGSSARKAKGGFVHPVSGVARLDVKLVEGACADLGHDPSRFPTRAAPSRAPRRPSR